MNLPFLSALPYLTRFDVTRTARDTSAAFGVGKYFEPKPSFT